MASSCTIPGCDAPVDERTVVVTYVAGTATVRSMRPDGTSARADADALRRAADVIDGWAVLADTRVPPPEVTP